MSGNGEVSGAGHVPPAFGDPAMELSRAAHDLNNLCASILGFAALTQESLDPDSPVQHFVGEILSAAQQTADLAHRLRHLSQHLRASRA